MALINWIMDNIDMVVFFAIFVALNLIILGISNSRTKLRVFVSILINISIFFTILLPVPYNYISLIILCISVIFLLNGNWTSRLTAELTDTLFINPDANAWDNSNPEGSEIPIIIQEDDLLE